MRTPKPPAPPYTLPPPAALEAWTPDMSDEEDIVLELLKAEPEEKLLRLEKEAIESVVVSERLLWLLLLCWSVA